MAVIKDVEQKNATFKVNGLVSVHGDHEKAAEALLLWYGQRALTGRKIPESIRLYWCERTKSFRVVPDKDGFDPKDIYWSLIP